MPPAEGEELLRETGSAIRRSCDLCDVVARGIIPAELGEQHLRVAFHDRQEIVEVVGDAAGELSDRLHAHCLAQALLEAFALRDVADRSQRPDDAARRVAIGARRDLGENSSAVLA